MTQRAVVMVVLGLPIMVASAFAATKLFGGGSASDGSGAAPAVPQ